MKTRSLFTMMLFLVLSFSLFSQPCADSSFLLQTQEDIDNFASLYPDCTEIQGNLAIEGYGIFSLEGLSQIERVNGDLDICIVFDLESLSGLDNLTYVGGSLSVDYSGIVNLTGLGSLDSVGSLWLGYNPTINLR